MMAFRVGQKVVCVDDVDRYGKKFRCLTAGDIYKVQWVGLHRASYENEPTLSLRLHGIDRGQPFWAHRFRPIVERKTDISIFKRLLTPVHGDPELVDRAR